MVTLAPQEVIKTTETAPSPTGSRQVFFPNLDGLRFICFLLVFLFHAQKTIFVYLKGSDGANQKFFQATKFLFQNGELGVNLFFVLSGFLITYLLLKEKSLTHTINLPNFYIRRVLRIWPLFYFCLLIGFVATPFLKSLNGQEVNEIANPVYYLLFINNFDYIQNWPQFPDALILIVLWSVAIEEQFYLIWPVLLRFMSTERLPALFILIMLATLIFRSFHTSHSDSDYAIRHFHTLSVIGDMALGGLLAYFSSFDNRFFNFIKNQRRFHIALIYAGAFCCLLFRNELFETPVLMVVERLIIGAFFGLVILEQNFSRNSFFKFSKWKGVSKMGLHTYGLYCLHFFVISSFLIVYAKAGVDSFGAFSLSILTVFCLTATIIIAKISFIFFEKPFLKLKEKFTIIR